MYLLLQVGCQASSEGSAGLGITHTDDAPIIEGDADAFYADGTIQPLALEISDEGLASLAADPGTWVEASFLWEGQRYDNVAVHIKGEQSLRTMDEKPSIKISFNEYAPDGRFMGMRHLVLNNMSSDASMLRERLAYSVFRAMGAPAARCNHAQLTINGEPYGLYANIEEVDEELLQGWFADWEGSMWEIHDADFRPGFDAGFEIEEGTDDRTQINALTTAMAAADGVDHMFEYVNEDDWWRYLTAMAWIGNLDGYPFSEPGDDAHLYLDPTDGLFHFLPHGLDETFLDTGAVEYVMHGVLATACIENAACKAKWRAEMTETIGFVDTLDLLGYVDTVVAEIDTAGDQDLRKEYTDADVDAARDYVRTYLIGRRAWLEEQLSWQ